jgi:hypothetical protein
MRVRILRFASLAIIGILLPLLLFVNIFVGNTLSGFGFMVFIVGLLLAISGVFMWFFCSLFERYTPLNPFSLYLVYGGLIFLLLGVICIVLIPVIHSFSQPWVFPD